MEYLDFIGAVFVITAYSLNLFKIISVDSLSYILLNMLGSAFLAIAAILHELFGILILQMFWLLLPLISIVRSFLKENHLDN